MKPTLTVLTFRIHDRVRVTNVYAPFPTGSTGTVTDPANGLLTHTVMVRIDREGREYPFRVDELELIERLDDGGTDGQ